MNLIRALWRGNIPLAKTYWLYGFLVLLLLNLPLIIIETYPPNPSTLATVLVGANTLIILIYCVFILVAVWRSASNYTGYKYWAGLAKFWVIMVLLRTAADIGKALTGK